ncbi:MAG: iron ABC transporter permease [Rhodospirillaceae bacterium]|nr:iron ABC transporter permease [Rhodospirillaceae bacterium]MCA8930854.1 iron ABC transporter permease [Rhodospirillaceae bacterium]
MSEVATPVPAASAASGAGRYAAVSAGLLAVLCLVAFAALFVGYAPIAAGDVVDGLFGAGDPRIAVIVQEIRLPRILLAAMIGAANGLAGAALQGLLRNPLADPGVIGVTASAALGAVISLYFGISAVWPLAQPLAAMAGATLATLVLYVLAARNATTLTVILAGVAISGFAVALTSLAMNLSPNPFALAELVDWLLGSVADRSFADVGLVAPFMAVGALLLFASGRGLDALILGEEAARSLGIGLRTLRIQIIAGTALAVAAGVAVAGGIGFVGLVCPHLVRPLVRHQPSRVLLPSALAGAVLLVAADLLIRLLPMDRDLMLGVVTSLVGAPFFFWLILRTGRGAPL